MFSKAFFQWIILTRDCVVKDRKKNKKELHVIYRLPNNMTLEEGAMLEPLSVAVYSCQRGDVKMGSKVLICGSGMNHCCSFLKLNSDMF